MPDVYVARFSRWIEKLFNVKGGPVLIDVEPALNVSILLNAPPVEERYLQSWNRFGAQAAGAAVAAQLSQVELRNPGGSGIVCVIESVLATQLTAVTRSGLSINILTTGNDLGTGITPARLDARLNGQNTSLKMSAGSAAGPVGGTQISAVNVSGTSIQFINFENQELTLLPGDAYIFADQTANEALTVGLIWRERALEQSELT